MWLVILLPESTHTCQSTGPPIIHDPKQKDYAPVVPNGTGALGPLEAHLDVRVGLVHLEEVLKDNIALGLVQADNAHRHATVHKE